MFRLIMQRPQFIKVVSVICLIVTKLVLQPVLVAATDSSSNFTYQDFKNYFLGLSLDDKKAFIKEIISQHHKSLPLQFDEYTSWVGMIYVPSVNVIYRTLLANVPNGTFDLLTVKNLKDDAKKKSINSFCSKRIMKLFMFEADTKLYTGMDYTSGQKIYSYTIDKKDCIEAGYKYP